MLSPHILAAHQASLIFPKFHFQSCSRTYMRSLSPPASVCPPLSASRCPVREATWANQPSPYFGDLPSHPFFLTHASQPCWGPGLERPLSTQVLWGPANPVSSKASPLPHPNRLPITFLYMKLFCGKEQSPSGDLTYQRFIVRKGHGDRPPWDQTKQFKNGEEPRQRWGLDSVASC